MSRARPPAPTVPAHQRVLCPYCGEISGDPRRCDSCRGFFDPLSRQATQNAMGPWFIRDSSGPWRPGCSIETLRELIRRGKVTADTILRGPGTKQFWNFAGRTPSIANLLGVCHNCRAAVKPDDYSCKACGAVFTPDPDRQHLGLAPVHILPGEASPEIVAAASSDTPAPVPVIAPTVTVHSTTIVKPLPLPPPVLVNAEKSRPVAKAASGSRATGWLVAATVVVLVGMGTVLALVASGKLTIPGLNEPQVQTPSGASPIPKTATGAPAPTTALVPESATKTEPPKEPSKQSDSGLSGPTSAESSTPATSPVPPTEPAPESTQKSPKPEAKPSTPDQIDLQALLLPLFKAEPFDAAAIQAKLDELRKDHPNVGPELDSWAAAAKTRAELIRLRKIP